MTSMVDVTIAAVVLVFTAQPCVAQDLSRYRDYVLGSSLASVMTISGARESAVKTPHERPAKIQELEWRAPYMPRGNGLADPVREVRFSFYDDQLYQVVVTYDRDRTEGLTTEDLVESLSATYGVPLLLTTQSAPSTLSRYAATDTRVAGRWDDAASTATLTRSTDAPSQYQFMLVSKALDARARAAIKEAVRLDRQEAPQRELDQHKKDIADVAVANQKARVINKPAFRP